MIIPWAKSALRWINLHPWWRLGQTRVWGNRLRAPTFDRRLALWLHRAGLMGVSDRTLLEARIKPGMTVVDIGANQGLYTLLFSRLTGEEGTVLAFEPDDLLHAALQENVAFNQADNVESFRLGLGSKRDTMTLYRSLLNSGDNRLAAKSAAAGPREGVRVEIERLDQVLAGRRIDFVKMDVQGWEMEVFRGMQGLLDDPANARMAIYFEYWPQGLRDAGTDPAEPLVFLNRNGFVIYSLKDNRLLGDALDPNKVTSRVLGNRYINLYAARSCD